MATRILTAVFGVASAACAGVGLYFPQWYGYTYTDPTTGSTAEDYSPLRYCLNSSCGFAFTWVDATHGQCVRTASDLRNRQLASLGLIGAGGILALVTIILCVAGMKNPSILRTVIAWLSFACVTAGTVLFLLLHIFWIWCDKDFCQFMQYRVVTSCTATLSMGFWLAVASCASALVMAIFSFIATCQSCTADNAEKAMKGVAGPTGGSSGSAGEAPPATSSKEPIASSAAPAAASPPRPALPEGDWVLDPDSGLYWSETNYLFLHLDTGQFFDPNTNMWFDSATQEWYAG